MKTLTDNEKMVENEKFLNNVIRIMKEGGNYICPNTMSVFRVIKKKLVPQTKSSFDWIKGVTTTKWCKLNVVPYVLPQMN